VLLRRTAVQRAEAQDQDEHEQHVRVDSWFRRQLFDLFRPKE
jgi:hypothetical protein